MIVELRREPTMGDEHRQMYEVNAVRNVAERNKWAAFQQKSPTARFVRR